MKLNLETGEQLFTQRPSQSLDHNSANIVGNTSKTRRQNLLQDVLLILQHAERVKCAVKMHAHENDFTFKNNKTKNRGGDCR